MWRYGGWKRGAGNVGMCLVLKLFTPSKLGIGEVVGSIPAFAKPFFLSLVFFTLTRLPVDTPLRGFGLYCISILETGSALRTGILHTTNYNRHSFFIITGEWTIYHFSTYGRRSNSNANVVHGCVCKYQYESAI